MEEVNRIIRVDHAGECGAIQIYSAQLMVARVLYRDLVDTLEDMLSHERSHFATFNEWLERRQVRPCYALGFWAAGGFILGLMTALMGRKSIWVCTHAIETTVLEHLNEQLAFLEQTDSSAWQAVNSIRQDEEAHRDAGQRNGSNAWYFQPLTWLVKGSTGFAIWLSTKL